MYVCVYILIPLTGFSKKFVTPRRKRIYIYTVGVNENPTASKILSFLKYLYLFWAKLKTLFLFSTDFRPKCKGNYF